MRDLEAFFSVVHSGFALKSRLVMASLIISTSSSCYHKFQPPTPMPSPGDISADVFELQNAIILPCLFRNYAIGLLFDTFKFPVMLLHVPFQVVSSLELSFANLTGESGTLMILLMFVVVCRVSRFVIAEPAFVFLVAGVDSLVAV